MSLFSPHKSNPAQPERVLKLQLTPVQSYRLNQKLCCHSHSAVRVTSFLLFSWTLFSCCESNPDASFVSWVSEEQSVLLCVSAAFQVVSEYSRKQKKSEPWSFLRHPRERMFPLFMLRRVHLSVTIKWPWLGSFQPSRFTSLNVTPGNIFRRDPERERERERKGWIRCYRAEGKWETERREHKRHRFVTLVLPTCKALLSCTSVFV